jgi:hypothetical protein
LLGDIDIRALGQYDASVHPPIRVDCARAMEWRESDEVRSLDVGERMVPHVAE